MSDSTRVELSGTLNVEWEPADQELEFDGIESWAKCSLGKFLRQLGITLNDCRKALEQE